MSDEDLSEEMKRFQEIAKKILIPMDLVINRVHRRENIREIYFAMADSRERLIQFLNLKRIQEFVIINLQMNSLLNKIIKLEQDSQFTESESLKLIEMISDWRAKIYGAVVEMTKTGI